MKRLLCAAATAALLSACATSEPLPPPPPPPPPAPMLSQMGADCAMRAAESDLFEIEAGRIAVQMGQHPDVRSFGQMMIDHHTQTSANLMGAIQSAGIAPPPAPMLAPDKMNELEMLRTAGPNFDAVFLQSQIAAHEEALALHQRCADGAGPPTAAVHASAIPIVQDHLARARMLADMTRQALGERG